MSLQNLINRSDYQNTSNSTSLSSSACPSTGTSQGTVVTKAIAYTVLLSVALIGNILIVFVIHRNKNMRTTVNYFIVNMALSDLIIPIMVLPLQLLNITSGSSEWRVHGTFGLFLCKFVYFVSDITPPISSISLVFMTMDRFCAVAFPMKAVLIPARYRVVLIAFTWVITMAFFAPYFYAFSLVDVGNIWLCYPTWPLSSHKIFTIIACVVFIIVPFVMLIVLYTLILVILRHSRGAGEEVERQRKRREKINVSVIRLALTIVIGFAICWGPLNAVLFITILWDYDVPSKLQCSWPTVIVVVQFLAYTNPAINPLICFVLNEKYRTGLKRAVTNAVYGRNAMIESSGVGNRSICGNRRNHLTREVKMTLLKSSHELTS